MQLSEIITAILTGDADDNLRGVIDAAKDRQKSIGRGLFFTLKIGDRVRFTGGQKYLIGAVGVVVRKSTTKVIVDLDEPCGRFSKGISCPVELLEQVAV